MMKGFARQLGMTTLLVCCAYCAVENVRADTSGINTELAIGEEAFVWEEFDDSGDRLLIESGPRAFFSGLINNAGGRSSSNLILEAALKGYAGKVNYDGQDSNGISVDSKTRYMGYSLDLTGGYRITGNLIVDMLAGVGINAWSREISDSQNALGNPVNGIIEDYTVQYYSIAAGFPLRFPSHEGYLKIGLRKPFSTRERVDRFNVTLEPVGKTSGMISYKFDFDAYKNSTSPLSSILIYYEGFRFDASPSKVSDLNGTPVIVKQPQSDMYMLGVAIGHTF